MEGSLLQTLTATLKVAIGIVLIAGTLQSYVIAIGFIDRPGSLGAAGRILVIIGGGLIALPTTEVIGFNVGQVTLLIVGAITASMGILISRRSISDSVLVETKAS